MLYDDLVQPGEVVVHAGVRGMRWSELAKAKIRRRRQANSEDGYAKKHKNSKTKKNRGRNHISGKPASFNTQNTTWSKPTRTQSVDNNKKVNKKKRKKVDSQTMHNARKAAMEKSKSVKMKRG